MSWAGGTAVGSERRGSERILVFLGIEPTVNSGRSMHATSVLASVISILVAGTIRHETSTSGTEAQSIKEPLKLGFVH